MSSFGPAHPFLPLSAAQREIWFAQQLLGAVPITIAQYVDLTGPLDPALHREAGRRAARELGLYQRFALVDGEPVQIPDTTLRDEVEVLDLRERDDAEAAAFAWMRAHQQTPFDVLADPAIHTTVLRIGAERHFLYTRAHHIALDGYGAMRLHERLALHYAALVEGTELPEETVDSPALLVAADTDYRASRRFDTDRAHWAAQLAELPEPVTLATRVGEPDPLPMLAGAALSAEVVTALGERAAGPGNAPVVVAAFATYLARMTGGDAVSLSLPMTARTTAALRRCAGMTATVLPLHCPTGATVGDAVTAARTALTGALRHQRYRGADMHRDAGRSVRSLGFGPAVNIMNFHPEVTLGAAHGTVHVLSTGPVEDLALNLYATSAGVRVELEANRNRYHPDELAAHLRRFLALLTEFATAEPGTPTAALSLLSEAEAAQLVPWRGTEATAPATLAAIIAAAVTANPDGTAIVHGERSWTYTEFDAETTRLARALLAAGAGPETLVAMAVERSAESVAAVWATTKSGAGFVPIDPGYPPERIAHILGDCDATLGVTTGAHRASLPDTIQWLILDESATTAPYSDAPITDADRPVALRPEHPAYLIYTSGSTGLPKGVLVTHGGLANLAAERRDRYDLGPHARTLHHASPGFDMAVGEILCGLAGAATLVVAPRYVMAGPDLAELMRRERVTNAIITPAVLATLDSDALPELVVLGVGGEAIRADLVDVWSRNRLMRNGYGPTEATDIATIAELTSGTPVTIGAPLRGFHAVVLDTALRPVPPGAIGELYLGGPALARGYHRRHALTATRFVADPHGPAGGRLYRTGDLVTVTEGPDPALIYHGRSDFQIKVRGHRIEPGEIETTLTGLHDVARAAVTAHQDRRGTHLVAYLVPAAGAVLDTAAVRAAIADLLPAYLRPGAYVVLDTLPLTPNGKLDARRLPSPDFGRAGFRAPATTDERLVAAVFTEILGVARIGADDDFFDLGGTSLTATQVAGRLGVGVRAIFDAPTVTALAAGLGQGTRAEEPVAGPRPQRLSPAPAQLRMWLLNQLYPTSAAYHLPIALRLTGALDLDALTAAVHAVVERHEVLRTVYPVDESGPRLRILDTDRALAGLRLDPVPVTEDRLADELAAQVAAPFDVTTDLPFRLTLWRLGPAEHVLALVAHHIAADGWSHGPLVADLSIAYAAQANRRAPDWAPLPLQYADYTLWRLRTLGDRTDPTSPAARQLAYWVTTLAGAPDRLALPVDRVRTAGGDSGSAGATVDFAVGAETADALTRLAREHHATAHMAGHAAFAVLLHQLSGSDDITVGTPVAGRGHPALDRLVGMFVNTLPLRTTIDADEPFTALLARSRAVTLAALDHGDVPFDHIVEAVNPPRDETRNPLFQAVFSFENLPAPTEITLGELSIDVVDLPRDTTHFDLALTLREQPGEPGYRASLRYATDLFDAATIAEFADQYLRILRSVTARPAATVAQLRDPGTDLLRSRVVETAPAATEPVPAHHPTVRELAVARVFADVLGLDSVAVDDNFFDLGGTSLLVFTLRAELAGRLGLDVEPRTLFEAATPRGVTTAVSTGAAEAAEGRWIATLEADAQLDPAFAVTPTEPGDFGPAQAALLTGATGFVGIHLLRELLDRTPARVWCLVRAEDTDAAHRRIVATMDRFGLDATDVRDRVVPLPGDLAAPRLGLSEADWSTLAAEIDVIYHNGAKVNHLEPYETLRAANVGGTAEVLRLAVTTRVKTLHYVSSVSVAVGIDHRGIVAEDTMIEAAAVPRNGYLASKWVAEQLVLAAAARGLPVAVHRPGLVSGATGHGAVSSDDAFWTLIRAAAHLGIAPEIGAARVTLAPVDYVARAVVALAAARHPNTEIYHLVNQEPTPVVDILDVVRESGYPVEVIGVEDAAHRLADRISEHTDLMRAALIAENYLGGGGDALLVDDRGARAALAGTGVVCPRVDEAVLRRYIAGFVASGLLPQPV
ncbi:amino acid adenylation domain-containing protein [Nocardia sp. NPDC058176]|uniref:amino acid adenylation domain-containing protein n=1 Tax=Nocardia sp. NPDC058176 TaxID=3346368 RepID=UPI0036DA182F